MLADVFMSKEELDDQTPAEGEDAEEPQDPEETQTTLEELDDDIAEGADEIEETDENTSNLEDEAEAVNVYITNIQQYGLSKSFVEVMDPHNVYRAKKILPSVESLNAMPTINKVSKEALDSLKNVATTIWNKIVEFWKKLVELVKTMWGRFMSFFDNGLRLAKTVQERLKSNPSIDQEKLSKKKMKMLKNATNFVALSTSEIIAMVKKNVDVSNEKADMTDAELKAALDQMVTTFNSMNGQRAKYGFEKIAASVIEGKDKPSIVFDVQKDTKADEKAEVDLKTVCDSVSKANTIVADAIKFFSGKKDVNSTFAELDKAAKANLNIAITNAKDDQAKGNAIVLAKARMAITNKTREVILRALDMKRKVAYQEVLAANAFLSCTAGASDK
jgi:hypothetical protein